MVTESNEPEQIYEDDFEPDSTGLADTMPDPKDMIDLGDLVE